MQRLCVFGVKGLRGEGYGLRGVSGFSCLGVSGFN